MQFNYYERIMFQYWKDRENELVDMYYNRGMSTNEIGKYFGVWGTTISSNMTRMGYKLRDVSHDRCNALYALDDHIFDCIDSEEKAYLLGYIVTDGHVSKNNTLMFCAIDYDVDLLENAKRILKSTHKICAKSDKYRILNIHSDYLCNKLREYGLNNRKSYGFDFQKILSCIPDDLKRHFIRGMFDGDGSITIYKYNYFKKHSYHFGFTCWKPVAEYVKAYFGLHTKMAKETESVYTVVSSCITDIIKIKNILYDNATVYCKRKYNTFQEAEKYYLEEK